MNYVNIEVIHIQYHSYPHRLNSIIICLIRVFFKLNVDLCTETLTRF